ncbi:MAG: hypothetical protein J7M27_10335 [Candidatus Latescibacteria bacterium]|nr:hypothetical protein [Candidatus Latescibacterota bacterium]
MSKKGSKKGFWSFLRPQKARLPESETSEDVGAPAGKQEARQTPKENSFDALFAYLDEEQHDAELESSTVPPEASEETKYPEPHSSAWEISEKTEAQGSEAPERRSLEEVNIPETEPTECETLEEAETRKPESPERKSGGAVPPDLGECPSVPGIALEKLRVLEEQVVSLESCIAERLESHP